jgi:hypothetical protein
VFHVVLLKHFHGTIPKEVPLLPTIEHNRAVPTSTKVDKVHLRRDKWEVLVTWQGLPPNEATWEDMEKFKEQFPEFQLEDELLREGRNVVDQHWGYPIREDQGRKGLA